MKKNKVGGWGNQTIPLVAHNIYSLLPATDKVGSN